MVVGISMWVSVENTVRSKFNPDGKRDTEVMTAGLSLSSLLDYVHNDNLTGLKGFLLNKHVQIDEADEEGWTALTHAIVLGKLEAVSVLIQNGADLRQEDGEGCGPLHHAAREGHTEVASKLLELGSAVDGRDGGLWTPLLWACYTSNAPMAALLLEHGADPNVRGIHHCTGIVWAAGKGNVELVKLLIAKGGKADYGDKYGTTPLIWACRAGHVKVVEELLEAGAQVDASGMYSWTPLLMAVKGNFPNIVSLLLKHSPNVNAVDQDGLTALHIACKEGSTDIAFQLLSAGAYVNLQDRAGDTNLIMASKSGHKTIVDALIKRYADLDTRGKENKTCIYWAVEKNHTSVVKSLLSAGADFELASSDGNTPLLRAVKNRNLENVQMLIDKKAKLTATDESGDTALHIAMRARSKAIVGALLKNPKHSQLLYKPNRAGETPYNIDVSNQKTILSLLFGSRKLNTNLDTENMLGYDLYGSALADILTEPSLSMPITVGLYAKWGSGKSFLLSKLREEMESFARDWIDPTFQFSLLLFFTIFHISTFLGMVIWIITFYSNKDDLPSNKDNFLALFSIPCVFLLTYFLMFTVKNATYKTDWMTAYNFNLFFARKYKELRLLVNVVFCHPPGTQWINEQEKAQPLKLFFTDQSKVNTSAGAENSVIQIIGSLYDSLEHTYGKFSTRLYRAFRPNPVKSTSPQRLRKLCCIPYSALYVFSYIILVLEVFIVIVKIELHYGTMELNESLTSSNIDQILLVLAILLGIILGLIVVSNIYTIGRVMNALIFSQRTHLQRAVSKHDAVQSEGYLQAVKKEVNLLNQMVKALDAFSGQQSRLIVIVDGLDSVEQRKILTVLDVVHNLFSNPGLPFIIVLAIDPHVIVKAIELNLNQVFSETSIGGNAYLRNMVHLPFFLQNAGLRKVKVAQQLSAKLRTIHFWHDNEDQNVRRTSIDSDDVPNSRSISKLKKKKRSTSESMENSISSNLHKVSQGQSPLETNKMLLTDDYFSDVNPRSMRRLMNVIYVMGRLLKAFSIEFSWHHLSSWANITEQWPYRTSWITLYVEACEDKLDDSVSLKQVYDKIKPVIPTQKEIEPLLEMDRDEKKLDVFLAYHKKTLTVANMKIFLPFTINLDPFIKKVIKDEVQNLEELGLAVLSSPQSVPHVPTAAGLSNKLTTASVPNAPPTQTALTRRQAAGLYHKMSVAQDPNASINYPTLPGGFVPGVMGLNPSMTPWGFASHQHSSLSSYIAAQQQQQQQLQQQQQQLPRPVLPVELQGKRLSALDVDQVCSLVKSIQHINAGMLDTYCATILSNNITGRVLFNCELDELKNVLNMNFGDWELLKMTLNALREDEFCGGKLFDGQQQQQQQIVGSSPEKGLPVDKLEDRLRRMDSATSVRRKQTSMERQVALEQATVSGLLSTLNENAQEDVLLEEIKQAREEADKPFSDRGGGGLSETEETDVLYYTNPSSASTQNIDVLSGSSNVDLEKGKKLRREHDMQWSVVSSRHNSICTDLDMAGTLSPVVTQPSASHQLTSIDEKPTTSKDAKETKKKRRMDLADRAYTTITLTRQQSVEEKEEDNPYAWLSKTAPPSPGTGYGKQNQSYSQP